MASNINPSLTPVNSLDNFRFWCQKVLPLVYDDSLSYYEVLGKMVVQLNDVIDNVNADGENVLTLKDAFLELQTYVNNFFDDIDQLASYAERAEPAQTPANTSAINAASSASNASASSLAAMNARDAAVAARQAAEASANTASTASANANTKANEAAQSAITAQTAQASANQSATLADAARSAAQTAASTATTKANEANTSATNAAESASTAENAASSVEASAQQIENNKNDIIDLKFSVANKLLTPFDMWANRFLASSETTIRNRKIKLEKNHIMLTRLGTSSGGQGLSLLTGENFAIGESNIPSITYNANQYLPISKFCHPKEYTDLYASFGEYQPVEMGYNGIVLQFVSINENKDVTYISHGGVFTNTINPLYVNGTTIKTPTTATHFGLFYITRRMIEGVPTDIVFTLNPHISDPVATALSLSN